MEQYARRCLLMAFALILALSAAGCAAPRSETYSQLYRRRTEAYVRWRDATKDEDALPALRGELSLEDAVKVALTYSTALQQVIQEQERVRGQLLEAYGEALPSIDLSADYRRLDQITTVDLGVAEFEIGAKDNWSYELSVTQPLFKGGAIPKAIKAARILGYLNEEAVRRTVHDVVLAVARAYYDVLLAGRLYEVQEKALEFAERNLRDVVARKEAGVAIRYDVLRAQVEVSNVRADLIRQRSALSSARTGLFRAMGVSQKSDVTLSHAFTYLPVEPSYEKAVETAFRNRPELYQRELDVDLQRTALSALYSGYLPTLEAWGWFRWAKPDPHEATNIEWDRQWQTGLRLKWELFDGLRRESRIVQQKAVLRQSVIGLTDAEQNVLQEVRNAVLDLGDARELVESQELNLDQANEALRLVQIGAREGVNTELEVLDARSALTRARGLHYEALHGHTVARLALQRAMGLLGPSPGTPEVPREAPPIGVIEAAVENRHVPSGAAGEPSGARPPGE